MSITKLKVSTYNIDGLPKSINLKELPVPYIWLYNTIKFFWKKCPEEVFINPDSRHEEGAALIADKFNQNKYDLIGLNEDLNYHNIINSVCSNYYHFTTYKGGLFLPLLNKMIHWHWFKLPSLKTDGLCLMYNNRIKILYEEIVTWNKYSGYFDHDNDGLMDKGFRYYQLLLDNTYNIDVYILHMDSSQGNTADRYNHIKQDIKARANQLEQLSKHIKEHVKYPTIIMGDFNGYWSLEWDKDNFIDCFINKVNTGVKNSSDFLTIKDSWIIENNTDFEALDKIFYINPINCSYTLNPEYCINDYSYYKDDKPLSDHYPVTTEFIIKESL